MHGRPASQGLQAVHSLMTDADAILRMDPVVGETSLGDSIGTVSAMVGD